MKAIKLVPKQFVLAVLLSAALLSPATAQASPATMRISSHLFPSGKLAPDGMSGRVLVAGGSSVTLTAPTYLYAAPVAPATVGTYYEFMFWDINKTLINTAVAKLTAPTGGTSFNATAWYLPICVVGCTGGGKPAVTTWAFSLTSYKVLRGTPIASVSPSSAWKSPRRRVSTATAVTINAQSYLGLHSKLSGTVFSSWFVFGETSTISGLSLMVPAGQSPYAIAFYYSYTRPPIPPCIGYPHCI